MGLGPGTQVAGKQVSRPTLVYSTFMLPKLYMKMIYCVSCAIHGRIVRVRNKVLRASPEGRIYVRPNFGGKGGGMPGRASGRSPLRIASTSHQREI